MARLARPNNIKGIEGKITINDSYLRATYNYEGTNVEFNSKSGCPALFNGISETDNPYKNFVLMANGYGENYIDFTVDSKSNIYAIGNVYSDGGGSSPKPIHFYKYNDSDETWELIGDVNTQSDNTWYLLLSCDKGRYKLVNYLNYVSFTEWFVESVASNLIKSNNRYYSIHEEFYDSSTKSYIPLDNLTTENFTEKAFSLSELTTEITIGDETFRPIDKFDQFQLISQRQTTYNITALKSDKELIISNQNLSTINAEVIHNFILETNKVANGNIKFAISNDNGVTWKTWNGTNWNSLTNTAPLDENNKIKQYSKLSDSEKIQWNKLKEELWTKGMSTDIADVDYNFILTNKTIRFAFVLYRPSYDDNVTLKDTKWLFDRIGSWHKLSEDDIDIAINSNMCTVTPKLQNLENVKVNILI